MMKLPTTTSGVRPGVVATLATGLAVGAVLAVAPAPAATAARLGAGPVPVQVLPVTVPFVEARDISESGVVVGTSSSSAGEGSRAERWLPLPGGRYVRQRPAMPDGVHQTSATSVTPFGEVAGAAWYADGPRAVLWSLDGRRLTPLAGPGTDVASGSASTWTVGPGGLPRVGVDRFVRRDGTEEQITPPAGLPEGGILAAPSTGGRRTALLAAVTTAGRGYVARHVVHVAGRDHLVPAVPSPWVGTACASEIRADGTVAFSGAAADDEQRPVVGIHHGGVPGRDVQLPTGGGSAAIACSDLWGAADALAPDDGVTGSVARLDTVSSQAAYWTPQRQLVRIAPVPGETESRGEAVAGGGRVVVRGWNADGSQHLYLWRDGQRRELALPDGWTPLAIVELTERGDVLANITLDGGQVRPAVWRTG